MTTSDHPSMLTNDELSALRALARGNEASVSAAMAKTLAAKGMISLNGYLTPAGDHAIHVEKPGQVPGIDT